MYAPPVRSVDARRLFLAGAIGLALWVGATFLWHVTYRQGVSLAVILFLDQDFPGAPGWPLPDGAGGPFCGRDGISPA